MDSDMLIDAISETGGISVVMKYLYLVYDHKNRYFVTTYSNKQIYLIDASHSIDVIIGIDWITSSVEDTKDDEEYCSVKLGIDKEKAI